MRPKPKVFLDIKPSRRTDPFASREKRINLSFVPAEKILGSLKRGIVIAMVVFVPFVFLGYVLAPVTTDILAQTISNSDREALENQLKELESQIVGYEKTIGDYQKQGATLANQIKSLNAKIAKINLEIKATTLSLSKLDGEIKGTTEKIRLTEVDIISNKSILAGAVQSLYENEDQGLFEVLLQNPKLSDFFGNLNSLLTLQDNLRNSLEDLRGLKAELVKQKEELSLERADAAALKSYQNAQKKEVEDVRREKDNLLKVTKGKESEYQKVLVETRKTASQIRSRIFEFLGGGELTFEQAYKLAKFAEQTTGVRAALILAVLDRESALGQNVGRCKYNEVSAATGRTAMHPTRDIPVFLDIVRELGLNPDTLTVSCANRDGAYGGAMGPAQFIPSTWSIYKDKIAQITGNNPSSPWRNGDAFAATALYLKDAGAAESERMAAARYYCGGRWNRYVCLNVYGAKVVEQARQFQRDIDILTG
ncbi:MAG: lytic murein transglycosylase [Candidatus Colwellbacteria bacterium]|nr:lytic murein transglycosylase [Candidatus Colwellbacteria bacterium]